MQTLALPPPHIKVKIEYYHSIIFECSAWELGGREQKYHMVTLRQTGEQTLHAFEAKIYELIV